MNERGFTLVELIISIVILAVAILALGSSTASLTTVAREAEVNALAIQACEDRIEGIRLHPIYQQLDSLYTESQSDISGMPGFKRTTSITRVIRDGDREGKFIDFTRITVEVEAPGLRSPTSRTVSIGQF